MRIHLAAALAVTLVVAGCGGSASGYHDMHRLERDIEGQLLEPMMNMADDQANVTSGLDAYMAEAKRQADGALHVYVTCLPSGDNAAQCTARFVGLPNGEQHESLAVTISADGSQYLTR